MLRKTEEPIVCRENQRSKCGCEFKVNFTGMKVVNREELESLMHNSCMERTVSLKGGNIQGCME